MSLAKVASRRPKSLYVTSGPDEALLVFAKRLGTVEVGPSDHLTKVVHAPGARGAANATFYKELFEMEEVLAPDFPFPVRWLRVGDLQLHLF